MAYAVKNRVNHQYIFQAIPCRLLNAPDSVPYIVRAAARVVRSSLSQLAKKARRKVKVGVDKVVLVSVDSLVVWGLIMEIQGAVRVGR
jgi:hypothetical protein